MTQTIFGLNGDEHAASHQASRRAALRAFLRRQSEPGPATLTQIMFDIMMGMLLPLLCLAADPIVFRSYGFGPPLFGSFQLYAYVVVAVQLTALGVWLACGARVGVWCGVLAGIMYAGALFSLVIGICLLPFSLLGLFLFFIGALGFTPFLTAFLYLRNARRALRAARSQIPQRVGLSATLAFGALLALGAPALADWRVGKLVEDSLAEIAIGDDAQALAAARKLRPVHWFASGELDPILSAYRQEKDPPRRERLARAYRELSGEEINERLNRYFD